MAKTTLNPVASQALLSDFLTAVANTPHLEGPAVRERALEVLGGGARADAVLQAFASVLAFSCAELAKDCTILDEEDLATDAANRIVLPVQAQRLQACIDLVEAELCGATRCPVQGCDGKAHSRGRTARTLTGRHGRLTVTLRHSTCEESKCGHRYAPAAARLGLSDGRFTPGCAEIVTMAATTVPHGKAVNLLSEMLRIDVSEHAVQDLVEARGSALLALDTAAANDRAPFDSKGLDRIYGRPADAIAAKDTPDVAYIEADGVLPMTRELLPDKSTEVQGARGGKGRKFKMEGREVKNAVLYSASAQAQEMPSRGCLLKRTYVSHLGHWMPFALLVWLSMLRLRFDRAKLIVVLSDGAEWIRTMAHWFPTCKRTILILDFYHAAHRVWELCRAIYGVDTDLCRQKARLWCAVIEEGGVQGIINELAEMRDSRAGVQETIDALATYFDNNKMRMDYPAYTTRGLRITSGIVESANFHVTGARLKQQGMRWSEGGAREMAMLRADLCNGVWSQRSRALLAA
jgi:hypothetical protein